MNAPATEADLRVDLRVDLLPETRAFLRDWLDWVERGAPDRQPYVRAWGLCSNASVFGHGAQPDLENTFSDSTPFGEIDYYLRAGDRTQHECPMRLAFARANASAPA